MPLHSEYESNLADAKEFEDFVFDTLLQTRRLVIGGYRTHHYQKLYGESATGVEVKLDRKFRLTGNLFIETHETHHELSPMKPSGIYHPTDPWLMTIGDRSTFWGIATTALRHLAKTFRPVSTSTSSGFLLPVSQADEIAAFKWEA